MSTDDGQDDEALQPCEEEEEEEEEEQQQQQEEEQEEEQEKEEDHIEVATAALFECISETVFNRTSNNGFFQIIGRL